ncbi:unnamed protein product [Clonostachys solani]|uniref:Zn(2)-C6 fungal-type domain-containing protein n=1 Tax=Clonostachys solani TaxID=160281 RepID=A0A9N9YYX6_9HYPO|nr:unnamed protein product [Clonostachys solani]
MVYCGKPSRGCENCRRLHTKCDQRRPSCSRCVRMKRTCVGYRDQSTLMFRDETVRTQIKAQRRHAGRDPNFPHHLAPPPSSLLSPQSQDIAVCYFYTTTLSNLSEKDPARQLQMHLPSLYAKSRIGSALRLATESISHVLIPHLVPESKRTASKKYDAALIAIQHAIQDPIQVKTDETLYAVLLLCGYETITRETTLRSAWDTHVSGGAALVQYRGSGLLQSQLAQGLFCFVRKSVVLSHIQACSPVDEVFTKPGAYQDPENQLFAIASRIPTLQSHCLFLLNHSEGADKSHAEELVTSLGAMDEKLSHWVGDLPNSWSYAHATEIKTGSNTRDFSLKHIHRYPDFYVARVWNLYRVSRLILLSLLCRVTALLQTGDNANQRMAIDTDNAERDSKIQDIVDDICASVPFLLGHNLSRMTVPAGAGKGGQRRQEWHGPQVDLGDGNQAKQPSTGSFSLIWPLYVASSAVTIPENQRQWIGWQLQSIAANGDSQAQLALTTPSQTLLGRPESLRFDCV